MQENDLDIDEIAQSNIISLSKKRIEYRGCKHIHMTIHESNANIKCDDCGEELDPIWVLTRYATEEQNMRRNLAYKTKRFDHVSKRLSEKCRTKCHHCQKMTPVNIKMSDLKWRGWE